MLRDKILFVVKHKFHSAILHKEMKTSKCGKLIQMTTGYFLRWQTSCHSFPGHPLSKIAAAGSNSQQTRASLSLIPVSCPPPPHPILGQTIDRCISLLRRFLWSSVKTEAQCPVIPPVELILLFKLNSLCDCSDGCWDNFPGKHPPSLIRPWCMSECPSLEYCWPTTTDRMKLSCG